MARITFQARDGTQDFVLRETIGREDLGQFWATVCQRSGLVEDGRPTGVDFLQGGRVLYDDAATSRQRNGADDRDWDADKQRAGSRDNQDREESQGIATYGPRENRDRDSQRSVNGTDLIPEPS
jgi:hypothetical protein